MKNLVLFSILIIPRLIFSQIQNDRFIEINGIAEKEIEPDKVELSIIFIETENVKKDYELKKKEKDLISLLKTMKIDLNNLRTDILTGHRHGYYYKSSSNKYRLSKGYKLIIDRPQVLDTLIIKLFEIGSNNVLITQLKNDSIDYHQNSLRLAAMDNANKKASQIVEHIDQKLGKVLQVKEIYPSTEYRIFNSGDDIFFKSVLGRHGTMEMAASNQYMPNLKKIKLIYIVKVKYELIDK
ncbi:MAG: SIMPL domain-containing protein [Bacteroidales bacterium]|nr:SIMPL domain-containing protein [Bacteroidales bacterium]